MLMYYGKGAQATPAQGAYPQYNPYYYGMPPQYGYDPYMYAAMRGPRQAGVAIQLISFA